VNSRNSWPWFVFYRVARGSNFDGLEFAYTS
jgi:hypothetical protein